MKRNKFIPPSETVAPF